MRRSARRASRESCGPARWRGRPGQFLFALVAPQVDCEVLEIGGSRGYSSIWLGGRGSPLRRACPLARSRSGEGRGVAAERRGGRPRGDGRADRGRRVRDAARRSRTSSTSSSSTRRRRTTSALPAGPRTRSSPAALFVADNVLSHADPLAEYSRARQADPTLESVTVPLDRGLELSVVLSGLE